jgi:Secretion system C-terminal sorting domain
MKKIYSLLFLLFIGTKIVAQSINYNFTPVNGAFIYNVAPTALGSLGSGVDDALSAATNIGFTFQYGCVNYTQFKASSNGWLTFNTAITGSNNTNNLATSTDRPIIAPLWDDLATGAAGNVNYKLTGVTPNRILTIEWKQMEWRYTATTWGLSFQVKLYETSNRIEFVYDRNGTNILNLDTPDGSIGLSGTTSGDYYSLDGTGASPLASKTVETTTLSTKPATGQIYQWDPVICSGSPSAGTGVANPSINCGAFTTTLSLTGSSSGCGLTYLWYQANAAGGPYTAIGTATSVPSKTFAIVAGTPKFFQCVVTCGASSATTAVVSASVSPLGAGVGSFPITLPYTISGQTTCGFINDITATNVTNVCGSTNYYTGEDVVYIFTAAASSTLNANVTSSGSYMGMNLYNGCPTSGGICVANAQSSDGNQSFGCSVSVVSGNTYYLVLDSWASPTCNPYNLSLGLSACASPPTVGAASANPTSGCAGFTSTLSLPSGSVCGQTYQWYEGNAIGGPYTLLAGAAATTTVAVAGAKFYQCVVSCGAFSSTSTPVSTSTVSVGTSIGLPYSATGQTTCGQLNDFTDLNTTICGSSLYYTGEDVLLKFVPAASGLINLTSTGSSTGLMLYNGCPSVAGTCVSFEQSAAGTKTLCANVNAGTTYYLLLDSYAAPACNPYNISISNPSGATTPTCNMAYTPSVATYSFVNFTGTPLPTTDDILFNSIVNFGFPFCFDGVSFNGGYVASNQAFVFQALPCYPNIQTNTYAAAGVSTGFAISGPAPIAATSVPRNAILAPWHDINPASTATVATSKTQFTVTGVAPNRIAIISWENIPMYSGPCETVAAQRSSTQIKLFETTNRIEIHVRNKQVCATFNNGQAILGLHNYDGTKYVFPVNATAHNATAGTPYNNWTMTNTAYQFNTTCGLTPSSCQNLVIPLGFNTFYAERVNGINNLYWETSAEEKSTIYKIQRSTDGVNFIDIGQVNAIGSANKYSFEDRNAAPGIINYYRIASVEISGKISYTFIYPLGSGQNEILNVSQIYPNPTSNSFMIALDSKQKGTATINIYDVFGRKVKSTTNEVYGGLTQYEIYVEDLRYGFYFVEVLNSFNELISKQKFLKN